MFREIYPKLTIKEKGCIESTDELVDNWYLYSIEVSGSSKYVQKLFDIPFKR